MNQILGWLLYCAIVVRVIAVGWNEPLRNRFAAPQPAPESVPATAQATPAWKPAGTSLDRAPYDPRGGAIHYTSNYDPKALGPNGEPPRPPMKPPGTPH